MNRHPRPARPETLERLSRLLERRRQADAEQQAARDALALATWEAVHSEGASARQIGLELGVSPTTVQGWVDRGRQLSQP